ncbi:MAG: hypothetical protein FJW27_02590 [Acidimicrobiia bacterium]|nr:hypothetical protein [Acidimicrobiia bacterium]
MRARSFLRMSVVVLVASAGLWWLVGTAGPVPPWESATGAPETATPGPLSPGARRAFTATAYCKGHTTRAGVAPRHGVIASDPAVLPLGSIVEIDADDDRLDGLYSVLDTGPKVRGRRVDLYMWSCHEALAFGKQSVEITVLRAGWNPAAVRAPATNAID